MPKVKTRSKRVRRKSGIGIVDIGKLHIIKDFPKSLGKSTEFGPLYYCSGCKWFKKCSVPRVIKRSCRELKSGEKARDYEI